MNILPAIASYDSYLQDDKKTDASIYRPTD
jgi:hypothetical protein